MGTLHEEAWLNEGGGRTRAERRSGVYSYYVPTPLSKLEVLLEPDVVGDVSRAEVAITKLNEQAQALHSSEGIARLLLRAEAVSSSHIEGLSIGTRRLLRAEMRRGGALVKSDSSAAEVVGNIHAMEKAISSAQIEKKVTVGTILDIHRRLCENTRIEKFGGMVRTTQNWVGGNSYNPLGAEYVPPAPSHVEALLEDIACFCNNESTSPLVQAALVHAQFETVHPFIDGNGRTGRALVHLVLRRRGLTPNLVPPLSLVMATHAKSYVEGLTGYRFLDGEDPTASRDGINEWVSFFAGACLTACEEAESFEKSAQRLQDAWREKLGPVRSRSALDALLSEMVGMPLFTIETASSSMQRSFSATSAAVERCVEAGIVKPTGSQKRNRVFEVPEAINEFNIFERRLASPSGDTRAQAPARAVPENLSKKAQRRPS